MPAPVVSVIMPVYNAEKFLKESIECILNQTERNFELLICDDASSDNSLQIINQYHDPRIRVFSNRTNRGYLATCNYLFLKARGNFITWQDADDISHSERLAIQVNFLESNPDVGLLGTGAEYFFEKIGDIKRTKAIKCSHQEIVEGLPYSNQFCGASVMIRLSILREVGFYQHYFDRIGNEDYDCFYRVAEKYAVENAKEILYFVRLTPNSVSRSVNNPRQLISSEMVQYFAKQRANNHGLDSLSGLDPTSIQRVENEKLKPYKDDPSLMRRKEADRHAYNGMYRQAFVASFKAFQTSPLKLINIKYTIACLGRYLYHTIR